MVAYYTHTEVQNKRSKGNLWIVLSRALVGSLIRKMAPCIKFYVLIFNYFSLEEKLYYY